MKREMAEKNGSRLGFTLIELLVVVSIIALLMAMLMPALNRARQAARKTACAVNMRSMYTGMVYYEEKYGRMPFYYEFVGYDSLGASCDDPQRGEGRYPESGWWYTDVTCPYYGPRYPNNFTIPEVSLSDEWGLRIWWQQQVGALIDNSHEAMGCPASTVGKPWDTGNPDQRYGGHFGVSTGHLLTSDHPIDRNKLTTGWAFYEDEAAARDNPAGSMRLDDVKMASSVALFFDSGNSELNHENAVCSMMFKRYLPGYKNNRPENPPHGEGGQLSWSGGIMTPQCSTLEGGYVTEKEFQNDAFNGRHPSKKINIMYADGHVGDMTADVFVDGSGETEEAHVRSYRLIWGYDQEEM